MKMKPYAAFGYTVFVVEADVGDERVVELGVDGLVTSGYYFYTKGLAKVKVIERVVHQEEYILISLGKVLQSHIADCKDG